MREAGEEIGAGESLPRPEVGSASMEVQFHPTARCHPDRTQGFPFDRRLDGLCYLSWKPTVTVMVAGLGESSTTCGMKRQRRRASSAA